MTKLAFHIYNCLERRSGSPHVCGKKVAEPVLPLLSDAFHVHKRQLHVLVQMRNPECLPSFQDHASFLQQHCNNNLCTTRCLDVLSNERRVQDHCCIVSCQGTEYQYSVILATLHACQYVQLLKLHYCHLTAYMPMCLHVLTCMCVHVRTCLSKR